MKLALPLQGPPRHEHLVIVVILSEKSWRISRLSTWLRIDQNCHGTNRCGQQRTVASMGWVVEGRHLDKKSDCGIMEPRIHDLSVNHHGWCHRGQHEP